MKNKEIFDRMIKLENASARNPNLLQTYEVMWNCLKQEIQHDKIINIELKYNNEVSQQLQDYMDKNIDRLNGNLNFGHDYMLEIIQQVKELEKLYKAIQIGRNNDRILEYNKRKQQIEEFKKEMESLRDEQEQELKESYGEHYDFDWDELITYAQTQYSRSLRLADKHFGGKK